jgi:hypothetical protein
MINGRVVSREDFLIQRRCSVESMIRAGDPSWQLRRDEQGKSLP